MTKKLFVIGLFVILLSQIALAAPIVVIEHDPGNVHEHIFFGDVEDDVLRLPPSRFGSPIVERDYDFFGHEGDAIVYNNAPLAFGSYRPAFVDEDLGDGSLYVPVRRTSFELTENDYAVYEGRLVDGGAPLVFADTREGAEFRRFGPDQRNTIVRDTRFHPFHLPPLQGVPHEEPMTGFISFDGEAARSRTGLTDSTARHYNFFDHSSRNRFTTERIGPSSRAITYNLN